MKKSNSKLPYVAFVIRTFYDMIALALAIGLYVVFREDAKTLSTELLILSLPILAIVIVFFDLRFRFRELKEYKKTKQL